MDPASSDLSTPKPEDLCVEDEQAVGSVEKDGIGGVLDGGEAGRLQKKARVDGGGDMKRVAEIVMALSAMGKLRGGRSPSSVEKGMMVEAREKLAGLCELTVAPKDLVTRDSVRAVVEDLGFNRWKDQRFGFRMPRMSIAEKAAFMERKAEESKEFATRSAKNLSQLLQTGFGANSEGRGSSFNVGVANRFPPDKPSPMPMLSRGFHLASPAGPVSTSASASPLNQSQVSEVQPAISQLTSSSSHSESGSSSFVPRKEAAHFTLGALSSTPPHLSQVEGSSSGDHLPEKTPASQSSQSSTATVTAVGPTIKVADHTPITTEGVNEAHAFQVAPQAMRDQISKSFGVQTGNLYTVYQPSQGTKLVQAPSLDSNHNDIARNVQKILQPRGLDRHWTPPSTDYMTKFLECQLCKVAINDAESLLVCDSCEKGVHLKCLQSFLPKAINKEDWHCPRCLIISNGKPFPPKYGRISRNISVSNAQTKASGVQASPEKSMGSPDQKANHQKMVANGKLGLLNPAHLVSTGNSCIESAPDAKMLDAREMAGSDAPTCRMKMDDGPCHVTTNQSQETGGIVSSPADQPNERANKNAQGFKLSQSGVEMSTSAPGLVPNGQLGNLCTVTQENLPDAGTYTRNQSQASCDSQEDDKTRVKNCLKNSADQIHEMDKHAVELRKPNLTEAYEYNTGFDVKQEGQNRTRAVSGGTLDSGDGTSSGSRSSFEGMHSVDWVDGILQIVDEKAYYESCCINGTVYKLQDHVLFRSNDHNLLPSKLQVLWEDDKTRLKWATVNRCYFPNDLPEVVGRPCNPENSEVYESNHGSNIILGSIVGPCKVLPQSKFKEESERRINLENGVSLHPFFLCKWFYDESNGTFQPVSE